MLFDLDATLLDHDTARDAAIRSLLPAHDQLTSAEVKDLLAQWQRISHQLYERYLAGELTFAQQRLQRITQFSAEVIDLGVRSDDGAWAVFEQYQREYQHHWRPFDDVAPTVASLRAAGLAMAVVTNGPDEQQRKKVARIGLTDFPVLASGALGFSKPDPRIFAAASECVRQPVHACLMVGDNPDADVAGARAAGMQAVLLDRSAGSTAERSGLPTIRTLLQLVQGNLGNGTVE